MSARKFQGGAIRIVIAMALLAALLTLTAMPITSSGSCTGGTDDYGLCISQTANDEPEDIGSEPEEPWFEDDCEQGGCR